MSGLLADTCGRNKAPTRRVGAKSLHFATVLARFEAQMAAYSADVGRRMREARTRNRPDLSQEAAAHEIGVSSKQYGRWETGKSQPRAANWAKIAEVLQVAVDDLRGKPPIAPEQELRDQLDRIETTQDKILGELRAIRLELKRPSRQAPRTPQESRRGKGATGL